MTRTLLLTAWLGSAALACDEGGDPEIAVLLIDGQNNHDWRATTPFLSAILESAGRFQVDVNTAWDPASFRPDLSGYDAVLLNYNGPMWPEDTRAALDRFVREGGGLVVVHAADNAFPDWPEYNRMIGLGGWGGRTEKHGPYVRFRDGVFVRDDTPGPGGGHGVRHEFVVRARAPDHPILRGLPPAWRHAKDELYDKLRGPAEELDVLATAFSDPKTRGTGEHEPILMTIRYGEGRVFHTTLGHDALAISGLGFQITLQRGAEWAATGKVTLAPPPEGTLGEDRAATRSLAEVAALAGWRPLFDGETLEGFTRKNGSADFRAVRGMIVGTTSEGSPNSFLCTDETFGDFDLRFEVMVDDPLNAGVQIRSAEREGDGRVHGPQVEISTNGNAGFLYGEALGTGWLQRDEHDPVKRSAFRKGQWNAYRVLARGNRIRTWINGVPVSDFTDDVTGMREGFIGLQVHAIGKGEGPYRVRWRNLYIRRL